MAARKSVVLVTVDCLRSDHVGFLGHDCATTPFLDSIARESCVVPAAIAAGSPTYYSFPATFASRFPLSLGRDILGLAPGEPTLASVLRDAGFATAAFSATNPYISPRFGYDHGFDTFHDFLETAPASSPPGAGLGKGSRLNRALAATSHRLGPLGAAYDELYFQYCQRWAAPPAGSFAGLRRFPSADVIVDHANAWLGSIGDPPFFLWLHLMDPHAPYYPSEAALETMGVSGMTPTRARYLNSFWNRSDVGVNRLRRHRDAVLSLYDAGVRWVDMQLERLVKSLHELERWDNCVFAITADHGEEFLDHGGRFHPPVGLFEETVHVPLLLRVPGVKTCTQSRSPFSLLHLAPTLLGAAGIPAPPEFTGNNYWPRLEAGASWNEPAIVECVAGCTNPFWPEQRSGPRILAAREERYKLILYFDPPRELLFDLEADPRELAPLPATAEKPVRRRLLERARAHLATKRDEQARLRARMRDLRLEWMKPDAKCLAPAVGVPSANSA
jgi:arylsulfatase A-like enzyme